MKPRQTLSETLVEAGVPRDEIQGVIDQLKPLIDFRRVDAGAVVKVRFDAQDQPLSLDVIQGRLDQVRADRLGPCAWRAARREIAVQTELKPISGEVQTSLWDAVTGSGELPSLVASIVDVFAWEIDFYTEVYKGDVFRLLVEKRYAEGKFIGYGNILAAEFSSGGVVRRAFAHRADADGTIGYYDEAGNSLRKQLLRMPMQYGNVTSKYGMRMHPMLGYNRQHNGVDYGVPIGTPVWSVGDGRVIHAGWSGGYGKMVEVRHANGYVTQYAHLSAISVHDGQHVAQKQMIGRVGSTGMSTGPHLHFGMKLDGAFVNPARQQFRRTRSLDGTELASFQAEAKRLESELGQIAVARHTQGVSGQEG
jgi:murein DD-endopeptidase MepM/ murein hydrolase activator NlpD